MPVIKGKNLLAFPVLQAYHPAVLQGREGVYIGFRGHICELWGNRLFSQDYGASSPPGADARAKFRA